MGSKIFGDGTTWFEWAFPYPPLEEEIAPWGRREISPINLYRFKEEAYLPSSFFLKIAKILFIKSY